VRSSQRRGWRGNAETQVLARRALPTLCPDGTGRYQVSGTEDIGTNPELAPCPVPLESTNESGDLRSIDLDQLCANA
jgi:hypothetical protein